MKLKVYLTINMDAEEYPVPTDGDVASEIDDALREYLHDIEGVSVAALKIVSEG